MAAHITATGRILRHVTALINQNSGYEGLLALFRSLASELPPCEFTAVSVASAGPLHAERGLLLDPTNFFTGAQSWGVLPLSADLKRVFKRPVFLENDAAATALGEAWKGGHGQKGKNLIAITLGTGVGIGVIANGQLIRAGRGLHPEASHIPINSAAAGLPLRLRRKRLHRSVPRRPAFREASGHATQSNVGWWGVPAVSAGGATSFSAKGIRRVRP